MSWVAIGVTVAGAAVKAGGDYYGAKGAADAYGDIPHLETDVNADIYKYVLGLNQAMPKVYGQEQRWRPKFGELNRRDMFQSMFGKQGMIGQGGRAAMKSQYDLEQLRRRELGFQQDMAGEATGLLRGISPGAASMMDSQTALAQDRYKSAQGLTAEERQNAEQQAREAMVARGRVNDNVAISAEILGREDAMRAKRDEAQRAGGQAFQMEQQFSAPALGILGQTPTSQQTGQNYLDRSIGMIGGNVPQFVDIGTALNIGATDRANMMEYFKTQAEASAGSKQATGGLISGIGGMIQSVVGGF